MTPSQKARMRKRKRNEEKKKNKTGAKMDQINGNRTRKETKNDEQPRTTEQEGEATPSREKETKPHTDHAYQPVGRRALILGTRLHEPPEEEAGKQKTQHLSTRTRRDGAEQEDYIIQDDVEYSEDTQLFNGKRHP